MYGALAALPHLRAQGRGALIHVSSVAGRVAVGWNSVYSASKHGMVGFLDALRLEIEREGVPIAVVNVLPGAIDTPIFQNARTRLGVQPRGVAPVYEPEIVAGAIVMAAEHPLPEIVVGGGGAMILALQRLAPRLVRKILGTRIGFEAQLTRTPKSPDAPSNLFAPTPDENLRVHGDLHAEARKTSLYTRLATSTPARLARDATDPILALAARAFEALWRLRFGKTLGVERPAPVVIKPAEQAAPPGKRAPRARGQARVRARSPKR
jgi:hypothetical protein